MENKYDYGDILSFVIHNEPKTGRVLIVDRNGTFEQHEYPSYDILVDKENMLYKHITEPEVELIQKCPIVDSRLVSDITFARRLCLFLRGIKATDLPSMEELNYLNGKAKELLQYQIETVKKKEEYEYLDRLGLIDDVHKRDYEQDSDDGNSHFDLRYRNDR